MSTVIATTVKTDDTTDTLTLGGTSDSVVIAGNDLQTNVLQDAGGNNIFVSDGAGTITSQSAGFAGVTKKILEQTASSSANIAFTSDIDSTYDVYFFRFINIRPATDDVKFEVNMSIDGGANYNVTKTTTFFHVYNNQANNDDALSYHTASDLAQGTGYQRITSYSIGNDANHGGSGRMYLYGPSSTVATKHFISDFQYKDEGDYTFRGFMAGYCNTTSAVNAVNFKMSSGNITSGKIALYGISKS